MVTSVEKAMATRKANIRKAKLIRFKRWAIAYAIIGAFTGGSIWAYMGSVEKVVVDSAYSVTRQASAQQASIGKEKTVYEYVFEELQDTLGVQEAVKGVSIVQCESQWRSDIAMIEPNDTISFGLWQINSVHNKGEHEISNVDKLDYKKATAWAIEKRLRDGNWSAWSCARKLGVK